MPAQKTYTNLSFQRLRIGVQQAGEKPKVENLFMKMNDKNMAFAIAGAQAALTSTEVSVLCLQGGELELNLETAEAKLWPGGRMKAHPHPYVVLDPETSDCPISAIAMWLPPMPGADMLIRKTLSAKGWEAVWEWVRSRLSLSGWLWIAQVREIEAAMLCMLQKQAAEPGPAVAPLR